MACEHEDFGREPCVALNVDRAHRVLLAARQCDQQLGLQGHGESWISRFVTGMDGSPLQNHQA
jgi:hypothetical protein